MWTASLFSMCGSCSSGCVGLRAGAGVRLGSACITIAVQGLRVGAGVRRSVQCHDFVAWGWWQQAAVAAVAKRMAPTAADSSATGRASAIQAAALVLGSAL